MKRMLAAGIVFVLFTLSFSACANPTAPEYDNSTAKQDRTNQSVHMENDKQMEQMESYTVDTLISDVMDTPVFGDYGRLIFPVNSSICRATERVSSSTPATVSTAKMTRQPIPVLVQMMELQAGAPCRAGRRLWTRSASPLSSMPMKDCPTVLV